MLGTFTQPLRLRPLILLSVTIAACHDPQPCPDCDEHADEAEAEEGPPTPDLPCGGADFMTDNLNCGSCGNACTVWWEGTDWEGGACAQGVCGPGWPTSCTNGTGGANTCKEICANHGWTCVANGCSGLTAMLFDVSFGWGCDPDPDGPDRTMTGSCDEQIPWMSDDPGFTREVMCCCGDSLNP
jgi:hypothetical protein